MKYKVAVDIGGTKIIIGLFSNKSLTKKIKIKTKGSNLIKRLVNNINLITTGIDKKNILGVGIGVAGLIDFERGIVLSSPNIPCLRNVNLKRILEKKLRLKVFLDNDANVAALGEHTLFYKKYKNIVCLTFRGNWTYDYCR